nr:capsid protein [Tick-associated circular DNA virus]
MPRYYGPRRGKSAKRTLNLVSRKKRNTMRSFSNTDSEGNAFTIGPRALTVRGDTGAYCLFSPTANYLGGNAVEASTRNTNQPYIRGFKENMHVRSNTAVAWQWRRICFTIKGPDLRTYVEAPQILPVNEQLPYYNDNGMQRLWFNQVPNRGTNSVTEWNDLIFKGRQGLDWDDLLSAPVDTNQVTLKSDKTRIIRSGNNNGVCMEMNRWYPMNATLYYEQDESGGGIDWNFYSAVSNKGMGDYYILDIINGNLDATDADLLTITATSSLYWHEK